MKSEYLNFLTLFPRALILELLAMHFIIADSLIIFLVESSIFDLFQHFLLLNFHTKVVSHEMEKIAFHAIRIVSGIEPGP